METRLLQKKCFLAFDKRKPRRNLHQRFFTLVEEVGELSEAILSSEGGKPGKEVDLKGEIADVFCNVMALSQMLKINIEKEALKKIQFLSSRR